MFGKIKTLIQRHKAILIYLLFGGLTTLVSFAIYWLGYHWLQLSAATSNAAAWIIAVLFAFFTNKPFVFHSHDWRWKVLFPELLKFIGCRVVSGILETAFLGITVDLLAWNGLIMKIAVSVVVVILNYIASKWLIFRRKQQED